MAFKFRLEKILHLIQVKETAKRNEIFSIIRSIVDMEGKKAGLNENIRLLLERNSDGVSLEWAPYASIKIPHDVQEIRILETKIANEKNSLEQRKIELKQVVMRRKGLESLRGKRLREFTLERDRTLQKRMDEWHRIVRVQQQGG